MYQNIYDMIGENIIFAEIIIEGKTEVSNRSHC